MINKLAKNIVAIFSIVILAVFTVMSLFYVVTVKNFDENVLINLTTSVGLLIYIAIDLIILFILKRLKKINKISKKVKIACVIGAVIIYLMCSIYWVKNSNIVPVDDSKSVNDLAVSLAKRRHGKDKNKWIYRKISKSNGNNICYRNFIQNI